VEPVQKIEFCRYLVTNTSRDTIWVKMSFHGNTGVEGPVACRMVSVCQPTKIIVQTNVNIETVGYTVLLSEISFMLEIGLSQSGCLEQILILLY
jgi:hypothetical protein